MRVTVITACRNAAQTLPTALESVRRQVLPPGVELEHIVVDGASTDGTVELLKHPPPPPTPPPTPPPPPTPRPTPPPRPTPTPRPRPSPYTYTSPDTYTFLSEPDGGLYDAINKGIERATGDVVGILNADDVLASDDVIARLAAAFREDTDLEVVYGDVRFVRKGDTVEELRAAPTVRYCTGKYFRKWMFRFATFPAHPGTFVRRSVYEAVGPYSLDYPICADFEMMLRLFVVRGVRARYLNLCTTVMRMGGLSTGGFRSNVQINREDLRALKAHGVWSALPLIYTKYLFKVGGFIRGRLGFA